MALDKERRPALLDLFFSDRTTSTDVDYPSVSRANCLLL